MQAYPISQSLFLQYNIGCGRGMWHMWRDPIRHVKLEIQLRYTRELLELYQCLPIKNEPYKFIHKYFPH